MNSSTILNNSVLDCFHFHAVTCFARSIVIHRLFIIMLLGLVHIYFLWVLLTEAGSNPFQPPIFCFGNISIFSSALHCFVSLLITHYFSLSCSWNAFSSYPHLLVCFLHVAQLHSLIHSSSIYLWLSLPISLLSDCLQSIANMGSCHSNPSEKFATCLRAHVWWRSTRSSLKRLKTNGQAFIWLLI